jgi:hypothetical protein
MPFFAKHARSAAKRAGLGRPAGAVPADDVPLDALPEDVVPVVAAPVAAALAVVWVVVPEEPPHAASPSETATSVAVNGINDVTALELRPLMLM